MRESLLDYLACPDCDGDLDVAVDTREGDEIVQGTLSCPSCRSGYPVERGVPRFAQPSTPLDRRTAQAFGYEWARYDELAERYRQQFLDWIRHVEPEFFRGKLVLEGGCGKGRHTALAAEFGARDVVAVDLSDAVDVAHRNLLQFSNAHVIQCDIHKLPLKRVFDYGFSVGVLHHLPVPERGFQSLVSRIRPGGYISAWVYGREGNGWVVHLVSPIRTHITARLPLPLLDTLSAALTVPLFLATRLLYGPSGGTPLGIPLPYGRYLSYISQFPFREQRSIVFDHLAAPVSHYIRHDDFAGWFQSLGLEASQVESHNANSWRGFGRVPVTSPTR